MSEVIFTGPEGRLEGRYHHNGSSNSPIALILHPNPQKGGNMNNRLMVHLFKTFKEKDYSTLRFNFRGIGRSQGVFDHGVGELSDAASALDWLQLNNPDSKETWIIGYSFGAWIAMQLLMRRPEISGFIIISPPANEYDFSFLAPCPSSGMILHGSRDNLVPSEHVKKLSDKLNLQKGINVEYHTIQGANHYFVDEQNDISKHISAYLTQNSQSYLSQAS